MRNLILILLIHHFVKVNSQNEDYTWICGAANYNSDTFSLNYISFLNGSFEASLVPKTVPTFLSLGIISDSSGNLLCYTNGIHMYNKEHEIMDGGNNFHSESQFPFGYPFTQSVIILPMPDKNGIYIMLDGVHKDIGIDVVTEKLRYSIIDMKLNGGLGKVTQKKLDVENSEDTLNVGIHTAVRHGNGKDWWTISTKYQSKLHRKHLITSNGIEFYDDQLIGDTVYNGVGYATFSPNGKWFAPRTRKFTASYRVSTHIICTS